MPDSMPAISHFLHFLHLLSHLLSYLSDTWLCTTQSQYCAIITLPVVYFIPHNRPIVGG